MLPDFRRGAGNAAGIILDHLVQLPQSQPVTLWQEACLCISIRNGSEPRKAMGGPVLEAEEFHEVQTEAVMDSITMTTAFLAGMLAYPFAVFGVLVIIHPE